MGGRRNTRELVLCVAFLACLVSGGAAKGYYGKLIGHLVPLNHQVKGEVYAVDSRTIHLRNFSYDGLAPDAFFYAGTTAKPSPSGFIIPDENGGVEPLGPYRNKEVTLTLPEGKTLKDIKWFSVWCRAYTVDFGHVFISSNFDYPRPQKIDALPTFEHGLSSDPVVVVDAQTFLIPNLHYDGLGPDAYFWVGKGARPDTQGIIVPDENGSEKPLKKYSGKTIVITLPGDLTVFDIDHLGMWCRAFTANFGHIRIPRSLNVPPSLKMLGVAPQTKLNCEVLWDDLALEVRWAVAGESIVMQLVGRIADGQYMSFGTSGSPSRSVMVGGDVVVAWLDEASGSGEAQDYFLGAKSQCQGGRGSCPDDAVKGSRNNVRLLNAALINDFTMLTFQRPLAAADPSDTVILTNGTQAVIWAVGPVNSQGHTAYHSLRLRGDMFVDFGRTPKWNCPVPEEQPSHKPQSGPSKPSPAPVTKNGWYIPPIPCNEPEDGVMYAQIGPTGGNSGYNSITGHVGWGIAWYINGLLIPEIYVVRGKTYTFVVEGGSNPDNPERDHPFYITDDPEGGYGYKTPVEQSRIKVFAGVSQDREGNPVPTGQGRLCEWVEDPNQPAGAFTSFGAYQRTLQLDCQEGQPGVLQWTPNASTPDTVYYQCYTHRHLGWKIHVLDRCDLDELTAAGSHLEPVLVPGSAPSDYAYYDYYYDDRLKLRPGLATRFYSNKIHGEGGTGKPSPPTDLDEEVFPNFSDYQGDFDNFPFHLGPSAAGPLSPTWPPSTQGVPLGAPGFTFPKLPNLKSAGGFVNTSGFDNLYSSSLGDEAEFPSPLRNQYPSSTPTSSPTTTSNRQITPLRTNSVSSFSTSTHQYLPSTPAGEDASRHTTENNKISTLTTSTSRLKHPTHRPLPPTQTSTREAYREHTSRSTYPTHTSLSPPPKSFAPRHHTRLSSSPHTPPNTATPTKPTSHPHTSFPHSQKSSRSPLGATRHPHHQSTHYQPEVITAPALPPLPGQAPQQVQQHYSHTQPPRRDPPLPRTTHSPTHVSLSDSFAQNFGFDPDSVVYESDFQPIKEHSSGPVLAFEVSPSSIRPLNAPLPPRSPPLHHHMPGGPRTSGSLRFTHRRIKLDSGDEPELEEEGEVEAPVDSVPSPLYHLSVSFSDSHKPLPLPVPMAPMLPLLGGAASNMPLKPARAVKPPYPRPRLHHRPLPAGGLAGPPGSVGRLGRPQPPARRLVASLIPLPEDHAIPVPQLVGPAVLQPVFPAPPPPSDLVGDLLPAASTQVFTSDGRPLHPDTIPGPPQLATPLHHTSASITGRPQVGPYRGEPPPPVPAKVPHLAQFSQQSRPTSRRTAVPLPPLPGTTSQPHDEYSLAGSAPRPVVVAAPSTTRDDVPTKTVSVQSSSLSPDTSKTHLTILKDVWAILTQDHPRDDAHPAHAHHHHHHTSQHLDGYEREPRRRQGEGD